jgi:hypothetical protein
MVAAVLTVVFVVLMRDAAAWRRGHQAAVLPTSVAAGCVIALGTAAIVVGRVNDVSAVILCAAVLLAGGLWSVAAAHRAVR